MWYDSCSLVSGNNHPWTSGHLPLCFSRRHRRPFCSGSSSENRMGSLYSAQEGQISVILARVVNEENHGLEVTHVISILSKEDGHQGTCLHSPSSIGISQNVKQGHQYLWEPEFYKVSFVLELCPLPWESDEKRV